MYSSTLGRLTLGRLGLAQVIEEAQGAAGPIWTTPADAVDVLVGTPYAFLIPGLAGDMHFEMQFDRADTFDTAALQVFKSHAVLTGWQYWDGDSWESVPQAGVSPSFAGNEARLTTTALGGGFWYRRVRAGEIS